MASLSVAVYAQDFPLPNTMGNISFGGGLIMDFSAASVAFNAPNYILEDGSAAWLGTGDFRQETFGVGGYLFLSATFVEFSVGILTLPNSTWSVREFGGNVFEDNDDELRGGTSVERGSLFAMDFTLLGRLPFIFERASISPLAGVGYQLVLLGAGRDSGRMTPASDLSNFRLLLGLGTDVFIGQNLFFRGSALGYYRFASRLERDLAEMAAADVGGIARANANGGFGVQVRLGVGVNLN